MRVMFCLNVFSKLCTVRNESVATELDAVLNGSKIERKRVCGPLSFD